MIGHPGIWSEVIVTSRTGCEISTEEHSTMAKRTPEGSVGGRSREKQEATGKFLNNVHGGNAQWLF